MLQLAQSTTVTIQARNKWNNTDIQLIADQEYQFRAEGHWIDWTKDADADGFSSHNWVMRVNEWQRRVPRENWFVLMGALDFDKKGIFRIGKARTLIVKSSGTLTCFANDVSYMYWNNRGSIQLTVTRLR